MSPADSTSTSSTHQPTLQKLKGPERYLPWSYFMEIYLKSKGLWKITSGIEKKPPASLPLPPMTMTTTQSTGTVTPRVADNSEAVDAWEMKDAEAQTKILAYLDESLYSRFRSQTTAYLLWKAIREAFEEASSQNISLWWIDLTQAKHEDENPLQTHIDRILEASRKLANTQFAIPKQILAIVILSSLPPSWDTVVTSLHTNLTATSGTDRQKNFTSQFVIDRLLEYEKMQTIRESSGGSALKTSGKKDKKKLQCTNPKCRRKGHSFDQCYAPGGPKHDPDFAKKKRDGK